jgi:hypothetical protein
MNPERVNFYCKGRQIKRNPGLLFSDARVEILMDAHKNTKPSEVLQRNECVV